MKQIIAFVVLGLVLTCSAFAKQVPIENFFRDAEFENVTISPKGGYLAVTMPREDRTILGVIQISDMKIVGKWDYGENKHIRNVLWVNEERFVFEVAKKMGSFDNEVGGPDLYATNVDNSKRLDIPNGNTYQRIGRIPGDDKNIIAQRSAGKAVLVKINTYTGKVKKLADAPVDGGSFVLDADRNVKYVIGSFEDMRTKTMRYENGNWTTVHEGTALEGGSFSPVGINAADDSVYVAQSDNGEIAKLVSLNPDTGASKTLFKDESFDIASYLWSSDRKTLLAVALIADFPRYEFIAKDHPEAKSLAGLINAFGDRVVQIASRSEDGSRVVLRAFSDADPGKFYLFDKATGKATFLLAPRSWINPDDSSEMRPIVVKARDGLTLHGYLTIPQGVVEKDMPLIVHPHGGPHGPRDMWGFNPTVQFLANRGYAVLQMNYRGSGGYGSNFVKAGYKKWGREMQDDLTDSVKALIAEGTVDPNRICIFGASYGGYAALMSPAREPDLYKCLVGYVGVYSLPLMKTDGDIPDSVMGRRYLKRVLPDDQAELEFQSGAYNVEKIKAAIMLVHGKKDQRVPISQMYFLEKQLKKAGKSAEDTVVQNKEAHGFVVPKHNVNLYTRMIKFFDKHIGPSKAKPNK